MDSADATTLQGLFAFNNACMDRQDEQMLATGRAVQALVAQVSELTTQLQLLRAPTAPPPSPVPPIPADNASQYEPRLPTPEMYGGEPDLCRAFLTKCSMFFSIKPLTLPLKKRGWPWCWRCWLVKQRCGERWRGRTPHLCCSSFNDLKEEMRRVFYRAATGVKQLGGVADIQQGERTVSCYSIEFRTLEVESSGMRRRSGTCSGMGWLIDPKGDIHVGATSWFGRTHRSGTARGLTPSAEWSVKSSSAGLRASWIFPHQLWWCD